MKSNADETNGFKHCYINGTIQSFNKLIEHLPNDAWIQ